MPLSAEKHVSSYRILVEGADVDQQFADRVREVRVISSLAAPDVCTLKILFSRPTEPGGKWDIDSMPFDIGKQVEVKLGDKESSTPKTLFKGDIVTVEPEFGSAGAQVTV